MNLNLKNLQTCTCKKLLVLNKGYFCSQTLGVASHNHEIKLNKTGQLWHSLQVSTVGLANEILFGDSVTDGTHF